jgi:hypothetical protein
LFSEVGAYLAEIGSKVDEWNTSRRSYTANRAGGRTNGALSR